MWPFKKQDKPAPVEPVESAPVRPCWCGSVNFTRSGRFWDLLSCDECGALYGDTTLAKNPCGSADLRKPKDAA